MVELNHNNKSSPEITSDDETRKSTLTRWPRFDQSDRASPGKPRPGDPIGNLTLSPLSAVVWQQTQKDFVHAK